MVATLNIEDVKVGDEVTIRDHMGNELTGELLAKSDKVICIHHEGSVPQELVYYMHGYGSRWIIRMDNSEIKKKIKNILEDRIGGIFYYDRKECEIFHPGEIEHLVNEGVITKSEIVDIASDCLIRNLKWDSDTEDTYLKWKEITAGD